MIQACQGGLPGRGQRFRQSNISQLPALPFPPPRPSLNRSVGRTGPRNTTTTAERAVGLFSFPTPRSFAADFVPEVISLPVSRISQDVLVLAFATNEPISLASMMCLSKTPHTLARSTISSARDSPRASFLWPRLPKSLCAGGEPLHLFWTPKAPAESS